ncbi:MAG: hypothetical protein JST54_14690 [Deltaproteobacteria bacterium]|nr:hypothetical protein [Deltaproteobacteria bacterium]
MELSKAFVPAADDMTHLETYGADADFFLRFSEDGHYGHGKGPYGTRQGTYLVTPSGKLLASTNELNPALIAELMKEALADYAKLPKEQRLLSAKELRNWGTPQRSDDGQYPEGGLVLREYSRDLPAKGEDPSATSQNWNMDFAWFTPSEAKALVPAHPEPGKRVAWPQPQAQRLVRFHFVDSVNGLRYGQKPLFEASDVKKAEIASIVERVDGARVTLRLEGQTRAESNKPRNRWVETRVAGRAVWDSAQKRFTSFDLVAVGTRWGGTGEGRSYDRAEEKAPKPIGFSFSLANDTERVPPLYVYGYGW